MSTILRSFLLLFTILFSLITTTHAQEFVPNDWQQYVTYDMDIDLNVETNRFNGTQKLVYQNYSPDTLDKLYYHLYFNAFQPNSMMDVRSRQILDPDRRVGDRIFHLSEDEIGYQKVISLKQNGRDVKFEVSETILIVYLNEPIPPGGQATMDMIFESQVPLQIRRSGRDSAEGIRYSMTQWYPRIAGYDRAGWSTSPYIAREFHGTFGDFDVKIRLDSTYTIGGTGYLQNPQEIGKGYEIPGLEIKRPTGDKLTWHFKAPRVIDFAWTAHNNYTHDVYQVPNGPQVHLLYADGPRSRAWKELGDYTVRAIEFLSDYIGTYPYEQFSVLHGGDGGMEYPMATLVTGHRNLNSLVGVMVHELLHIWFQASLATDESKYAWMDEGFTSYMTSITTNHLFGRQTPNTPIGSYLGYLSLLNDEMAEPANTHSDRYNTNRGYSAGSYTIGSIVLGQLGYIMGEDALKRTIQRYFDEWKFRHPNPTEFRRVAEKESGLQLEWFFDQQINTTKTIDYSIEGHNSSNGILNITLARKGEAVMPVDLVVHYNDGSRELIYVPIHLMLGIKPEEPEFYSETPRIVLSPWRWTDPEYEIQLNRPGKTVSEIILDPTLRMMDANRLNNTRPFPLNLTFAEPLRGTWNEYQVSYRPAIWYGQESGFHFGLSTQGSYLFNNNRLDAGFMITTGDVDQYDVSNVDVDYNLSYIHKLKHFGNSTSAEISAKRFYGIGEESLTLNKYIGQFGVREPLTRFLSLKLFHQYSTNYRNIAILQSKWDKTSVFGLKMSYAVGNASVTGVKTDVVFGSQARRSAAGLALITANKTYKVAPNLTTRFGMSVGTGSESMPTQWKWAVSGPTGEQLWNNNAYWAINNIHSSIPTDLNLLANDGAGLLGYGLMDIGSPDIAANNYFTGTIWNSWQPFSENQVLRLLALELFAATGKSWNGTFFRDFPEFSSTNPLLASIGTGVTFDLSSIPALRRWKPQSKLLQDLQLSVRMPFFMNGLQNHNDWGARFVIGVSESF